VKRVSLALALLSVLSGSVSTGCMGTAGLSGKLKKFNLEATENRWGREGIFFVLNVVWIYRICTILDLFIFNSIEFWSGTNPLNGKSPMVDVPMSEVEKIGFHDLERAQVELVSENAAKLHLDFLNGDRMAFDVLREHDDYTVSYLGRVFFEGKVEPAATLEAAQ
jgi:Domain of unknown function (DUF3332)